jgi:hypothetical protein
MKRLALLLVCLLSGLSLVGCGGGGGSAGGDANPTPPQEAETGLPASVSGSTTLVRLLSAKGDPVGDGQNYEYSLTNSTISVEVVGTSLRVVVLGDERWNAVFTPTTTPGPLKPLLVENVRRETVPGLQVGMDWSGESTRLCVVGTATISVDSVRYVEGQLKGLELRFEQRCGSTGSLRGQIRWVADDPTRPAGPAATAPPNLWKPAASALPATGNYLYFEPVGQEPIAGTRKTLTENNAAFRVDAAGGLIDVIAAADDRYFGVFRTMRGLAQTTPGYYEFSRRYPDYNPARGGMAWTRGTAACEQLRGWFVVDDIAFDRGRVSRLALHFEQRCNGDANILRGAMRWSAADTRLPPAPGAAPTGTWQAPPASIPTSGTYLFLQSEPGDFVGGGVTQLVTPVTDNFKLFDTGGQLNVQVTNPSGQSWSGNFWPTATARRVLAGYFGAFTTPYINPALGGLRWGGYGRGCELNDGWFAIDRVSHSDGVLRSVEMRFEQRCKGSSAALRGQMRWVSTDTQTLNRPIDPPPQPAALAVDPTPPGQGNYVFLRSGGRDFIGGGGTYLHTPLDASLSVQTTFLRNTTITVQSGQDDWTGTLLIPRSWSRIETGRRDFARVATAAGTQDLVSFDWAGNSNRCDATAGWIDILRADYQGDTLVALDLDFEQHCDGSPYPLQGKVRWTSADTRQPHGPVRPVPQDLWAPDPAATPATGNFVFIKGAPGEFVSDGKTLLITLAANESRLQPWSTGFNFSTLTSTPARVWFTPMTGLKQIERGYYPGLPRALLGKNPNGGLDVGLSSRGCNDSLGWAAVDEVAYSNGELILIDMRFQQLCEGEGPPLYGRLRWQR